VALADGTQDNHEMLDWIHNATLLKVASVNQVFGIFKIANIQWEEEYVER
jgi:hypothetical protein